MPGCDDFEIAIEMRRHGALDGDGEASARLDAHLLDCGRCRAFEAAARRTEAAMQGAADAAVRAVDWEAVERALGRWRRRQRAALGAFAFLLLALLAEAAAFWRHDGPARDVGPAVALSAALLAVAAAASLRRTRRLALAGRTEETLALLRGDLRARLRALRVLLWALPLYGLGAAWLAATAADLGVGGRAALACCALAVAPVAIFAWRVKRPALLRELADLGAPPPG